MKELNALERSAKWNAENYETVTVAGTKEILAIAEAFRALEQRAESAEAKLAELDKQEPFAYCITDKEDRLSSNKGKINFHSTERYSAEDINEYELSAMPLFARAALPIAAIRLPDDVPDLMNLSPEQQTEFNRGFWYGVEKVKRLNATATAINLAELVPDAIDPDYELIKRILPTANPDEYACCVGADMWNACRSAMIAKLENHK